MKKITLLFLFTLTYSICAKAQSYLGFLTDNYSGVNSVIVNPANIVDSRFKTDINLLGVSGFVGNDYYGINIFDAFKSNYDFDGEAITSPSNDNNLSLNIDAMGPSFMFNINESSSIAVFTRQRGFINISKINGEIPDVIDDDETDDFTIDEGDFNIFAQSWAEIGVTYARIIVDNNEHFIKGGLTLNFDADGVDLGGGQTTGSINATGDITYGRSGDFDSDDYDYELPEATGFGVDLGLVYEWRPDYVDYTRTNAKGETYTLKDKNKYKLKLGLSITDIGRIKYKEGIEDTYSLLTPNISEDDFDDADDIDDFLNSFYTLTSNNEGFNTKLPTAVHLNADWNFTNKLYLNLNSDFSLVSKDKLNASRISNVVSLTPRFESKWFSFYYI